jgi:hypothetical protein
MKYELQEHEAKKLFTGRLDESVGTVAKIKPETIQQLNEAAEGKGKRKLIVQMEAIHVGRTANYTFYTEQGLKDGLNSWTHPYNKPVLTHHNSHDGEAIGRILRAEFAESTMSGRKGLIFTCEITGEEAVEKVLDGRYHTVSIGATTDKVTCNMCGTDRTKEWCEHWRGEEYEGQTCHFTIGTTFGREVSYVNVPADEDAGNFSVSIEDGDSNESAMNVFQIAEGLMQNVNIPEVNLYESASDDIRQLVDGLMTIEEGGKDTMTSTTDPKDPKEPVQENAAGTVLTEAQLQEKLTIATDKIAVLEKDLSAAQSTLATQVIEKTKVDGLYAEAQADVDRLTQENATLVEGAHKALAEKVVDMKLALRKSDVVGGTKEDAVTEHIKRSEDSLRDAATDLQAEMASTLTQVGVVKSPGAAGEDNNPNTPKENEEEKMTISEATSMFKGMFGSKKKR